MLKERKEPVVGVCHFQVRIPRKGGMRTIPAKNPPMWANHATPGAPPDTVIPFITCRPIQRPRSTKAGIRMTVMKTTMKMSVFILAKGMLEKGLLSAKNGHSAEESLTESISELFNSNDPLLDDGKHPALPR